ncbi:MAG: site-specific DNA-methyltransferase [Anaerolineae bacterium]|nr:site-specific DNA-methyltransferase [Anaerolineae bacterium]
MTTVYVDDVVAWLRGREWLVLNGYLPRYHAVLCDPPYGLAFMGQHWDAMTPHQYHAWVTEWARLLLSFVYPGAVLLAFGGTRTYHRLAAGLEDAGWEIADSLLYWGYGSGFPKSHDISKALDREAGAEREVVGRTSVVGAYRRDFQALMGYRPAGDPFKGERDGAPITAPATPLAAQWDGYGTALKPAYEPVLLARAPRNGHTYAALAREFGTGALNVDGARVGTGDGKTPAPTRRGESSPWFTTASQNLGGSDALGRWPSNVLLGCACAGDEHDADCPVEALRSTDNNPHAERRPVKLSGRAPKTKNTYGEFSLSDTPAHFSETPVTADRFFYTAKAGAFERECGLKQFQLRRDLTPEKRAWVEAELTRRGL